MTVDEARMFLLFKRAWCPVDVPTRSSGDRPKPADPLSTDTPDDALPVPAASPSVFIPRVFPGL